jgi:hypothetical protein
LLFTTTASPGALSSADLFIEELPEVVFSPASPLAVLQQGVQPRGAALVEADGSPAVSVK